MTKHVMMALRLSGVYAQVYDFTTLRLPGHLLGLEYTTQGGILTRYSEPEQ